MLSRIAHILNPSRLLEYQWVRVVLIYTISLSYLLALVYFITKDNYYLVAVPLGLAALWIGLTRMEWLFWMVVFFVPFSFPLKELAPQLGLNLFLPTEPILAGLAILFIWKMFLGQGIDKRVLNHPITQVIIVQLIWIVLTSITSTMPEVSFKYLASRFWFVAAFYFMATQIFSNPKRVRAFIWVYLIPLAVMVIVITMKHAQLGLFDQKASNPAVDPFFNDHTLYGAIMALMVPVAFGYLFKANFPFVVRLGVMVVLGLLLTGLLFSYSRAAWVSVVGSIGVYLLVYFKVKGRLVLLGTMMLLGFFLLFGKGLLMKMEKNDQDSSDNLTEHVQSISNISTDASNLERLNRWSCAIRMGADKPLFGYGPGTYMFQYAPFQKDSQKTIISTNAADGGNAHSEFLGPFSEMGIIGALLILVLVALSIRSGIKTYYRIRNPELKMVVIAVTLGLITYYAHGIMNNFMDTDKASAGVWGFMAIIVALDVWSKDQVDKKTVQ